MYGDSANNEVVLTIVPSIRAARFVKINEIHTETTEFQNERTTGCGKETQRIKMSTLPIVTSIIADSHRKSIFSQ